MFSNWSTSFTLSFYPDFFFFFFFECHFTGCFALDNCYYTNKSLCATNYTSSLGSFSCKWKFEGSQRPTGLRSSCEVHHHMGATRKWSPEVAVAYKKPHCAGWGRWAVTCLGWGLGATGTPHDPGLCQTLILKPGLAGKSLLWGRNKWKCALVEVKSWIWPTQMHEFKELSQIWRTRNIYHLFFHKSVILNPAMKNEEREQDRENTERWWLSIDLTKTEKSKNSQLSSQRQLSTGHL